MKRYRLVYRGSRDAYYSFDTHTKKRESLTTSNAAEAQRLVDAKNEAVQHIEMNLQMGLCFAPYICGGCAPRGNGRRTVR